MNITIIGLGVIGGSLGLAIKQIDPEIIVTGFDSVENIDAALQRDAIDFGSISLPSLLHDADIIFLCTPVHAIIDLLPIVAKNCKRSAIITDVGSTKLEIVNAAKKMFGSSGVFIGGHPMAGSEGKGIEFADALLFQNATYVLCADNSQKRKITKLTSLLQSIGARVLFLSAKDHDTIAASISHLPQLIAVAMMNMVEQKNKRHPGYLQLAAGGFRDITRIASSPYGMWNDILASNSIEIRNILKEFSSLLSQFEKELRTSSPQQFFAERFKNAKIVRDAIPKNSKGFLQPLYDVFVSVNDAPGVLSVMTTALFKANINIKDMELLKIREGRGGTFRLSFESKHDADLAKVVLIKKNFTTI